ncbi:diadenosine tetraphosphate (Ap4A) HIT family hydrolase [Vogesella indigofera]|uniref:Diadenosine tetraphosphate (Ap4A) HIT family hydrolase n=1 Tax=Vogesella indigofera TaxID=45465 RepID=A0A495BMH8_VOGIN|nr:HIT family protein [Vogesella indigofera]RKQ62170.1 diadenosine tetraphosphate (Ap4A) HIT family hydrolase [Vogesella indigofera]
MQCELCHQDGGDILYRDDKLRVILVADADYPAFCRVIWHAHVKEMTDLDRVDRAHVLDWVLRTEQALREVLNPDKINLASFGNMVPHLHWHVIPRFADDKHFPNPLWGVVMRDGVAHGSPTLAAQLRHALQAG